MINGKILETSIEKLKYLYGLKPSRFKYNSIEVRPHLHETKGRIYVYSVQFDIIVPMETDIDTVSYELKNAETFLYDLLHEYSLSQDGKLVYGHPDDFVVSQGHLIEAKSAGWESINFKIDFTIILEN